MVGSELVDWLLANDSVMESRQQAVGVWQALLEEGVLQHGKMVYIFNHAIVDST